MYEGDTPNAERRAAALSLDRDLLRELLGQEELRELIDPGALEQVEADLQHRSDRTRAGSDDALADVLRRVGDLTPAEAAVAAHVALGTGVAAIAAATGKSIGTVRTLLKRTFRKTGTVRQIDLMALLNSDSAPVRL